MTSIARELAAREWLLRSGGSPGADTAFEKGCDLAGGRKEIYLPWRGFNHSDSPFFDTPAEATTIALRVHPGLLARSWRVRKLRARNVCQLLGQLLNEPSHLVIAWTEGGMPSGGPATVLQFAEERGIPVINLGQPEYSAADSETKLTRVFWTAQRISSSND
jgi:hypothetical protein